MKMVSYTWLMHRRKCLEDADDKPWKLWLDSVCKVMWPDLGSCHGDCHCHGDWLMKRAMKGCKKCETFTNIFIFILCVIIDYDQCIEKYKYMIFHFICRVEQHTTLWCISYKHFFLRMRLGYLHSYCWFFWSNCRLMCYEHRVESAYYRFESHNVHFCIYWKHEYMHVISWLRYINNNFIGNS